MKLKSVLKLALSAVLFAGLGAGTIAISTVEASAATAAKKKTTRKKAAASVSLANKTFKGVYYTQVEQEVEIYFYQQGLVCSVNIDGNVSQGTYKVTGKKVTIKYWEGAEMTWTFDIKNNGTKLYYEESTPRHVYECELNLVK